MIETNIDNKRVFITETVFNVFSKFRQFDKKDHERGGVVIGQVSKSSGDILICRASIATQYDKSATNYFHRDKQAAQQIIDYEYYNSEGKNTYLGEWHTHPSTTANPSGQDLSMIKKQFEENELKNDFIFMFIVGQRELYIGLYNGHKIFSFALPIHN